MALGSVTSNAQSSVLSERQQPQNNALLVVALAIYVSALLVYLLFLPNALQYKFDYYYAEIIFLSAVILLFVRAANNADNARTRLFWQLISIGFGLFLVATISVLTFKNSAFAKVELGKDIVHLFYYSAIAVAIELRLDRNDTGSDFRQYRVAAIGSVLLIFAAFAYFGILPLIPSNRPYATPYAVHACLDSYFFLRFILSAFQTHRASWRRLFAGLSLMYLLMVAADILSWLYRQDTIDYRAGDGLNIVWYLWIPVAMLLSTLRLESSGKQSPQSEDTKLSIATRGLVAFGLALPLIHVSGYGMGYFDTGARQSRDLLVSAWILLTLVLLFGVYFYFRGRVVELDEQRSKAELKAGQFENQLSRELRIRSLGRLSAGLAHDFGNSLTAISMYAEIIQDAKGRGGHSSDDIDGLTDSIRYAKDIVEKLRLFSNSGDQLKTELLNFNEETVKAVELIAASLPYNVELRVVEESADMLIMAELPMVHQVVINYIYNAVDAMPDGGEITVLLRQKNGKMHCATCGESYDGLFAGLEVSDTGPGVDPELADQIFEPLISSKPEGKGSGLGLSTVHVVMHSIGGHVALSSSRNGGACFGACFPIVDEQVQSD